MNPSASSILASMKMRNDKISTSSRQTAVFTKAREYRVGHVTF